MNANGSYGQLWKMRVRKQLTFLNILKHSGQERYTDYKYVVHFVQTFLSDIK